MKLNTYVNKTKEQKELVEKTLRLIAQMPDDKSRDIALIAAGYMIAESRHSNTT